MIVNLFAGPGGWCEGLRLAGRTDGVGIEYDAAACATRAAAGHLTVRADVRDYPAERFADVEGLIASPPCPQFSAAGGRLGALLMAELAVAIADALDGRDTIEAHRAVMRTRLEDHLLATTEADTGEAVAKAGAAVDEALLTVEPARWIRVTRPRWVAMEQVPAVLPLFKVYAEGLRSLGYSAVAVELNAADFGVPQTRRRAFLMAHRDRAAIPPAPTHCRGGAVDLFGALEPWVSMAEALGWGLVDRPSLTTTGARSDLGGGSHSRSVYKGAVTDRLRGSGMTARHGARRCSPVTEPAPAVTAQGGHASPGFVVNTGRDWKPGGSREDAQEVPITEPAPAIDGKGRWHLVPGLTDAQPNRRTYPLEEPAPIVAFGHDAASWAWNRPATTIPGDPRVSPPGWRGGRVDYENGVEPASRQDGAIRIEAWEAGVLQSFPADYPWQGTKTKQFEQIGNAVPPLLAARVVAELID